MKPDLVEVIIRPRHRLWHGGAVHLPGSRLSLPDDADLDALYVSGVIAHATPDEVAAIEDAVTRRLPAAGYGPLGDDPKAAVAPGAARLRGQDRAAEKVARRRIPRSALLNEGRSVSRLVGGRPRPASAVP
jgi:hypothetical protein